MEPGSHVSRLEVTLLLKRTAARVKLLNLMVKQLELPRPKDRHVLGVTLLTKKTRSILQMHIDYLREDGKSANLDEIWLNLTIKDRPKSTPPKEIKMRKQDQSWALECVSRLLGKDSERFVVNAQVSLSDASRRPSSLPPHVVGNVLMPVTGGEYAVSPSSSASLREIRWKMNHGEKGFKVWITFLDIAASTEVENWPAVLSQRALNYANEAFPQ